MPPRSAGPRSRVRRDRAFQGVVAAALVLIACRSRGEESGEAVSRHEDVDVPSVTSASTHDGEFVLVPAHTRLWTSADRVDAIDPADPADSNDGIEAPAAIDSGEHALVMRRGGRTGDVLELWSEESEGGRALPGFESFRLRLFVAVEDVQCFVGAPSEDPSPADELSLRVEVLDDGFRVWPHAGDEAIVLGLSDEEATERDFMRYDFDGLERIAAQLKSEHRWATTVRLAPERRVPAQVLVSTVDALAGRDCRRDAASLWANGGVPGPCNFWRVIMEQPQ